MKTGKILMVRYMNKIVCVVSESRGPNQIVILVVDI
jgi:hypothetical protein